MKSTKVTWIGFIVSLSALLIPSKTIAHNSQIGIAKESSEIENRLSTIAKILKERENYLDEFSDESNLVEPPEDIDLAGWVKGYRGGFANRSGGGGFVNRRYGGGWINSGGWRDRGGFLNRRPWGNRGGFLNRR